MEGVVKYLPSTLTDLHLSVRDRSPKDEREGKTAHLMQAFDAVSQFNTLKTLFGTGWGLFTAMREIH